TRIAFVADPKGPGDIYVKPADGSKPQTLLWASDEHKEVVDWSRDGRFVLARVLSKKTSDDLWAMPLDNKPAFAVADTPSSEMLGRFSPDGRWIVFQSNDAGRYEIYAQPFPGPGDKRQITNSGGQDPKWRPDGRELFYTAFDGRLM